MFKSYFKIAFRSLRRNGLYLIINKAELATPGLSALQTTLAAVSYQSAKVWDQNKNKFMKRSFVFLITLLALCQHAVQAQSIQPDLSERKNFTVTNRDISITKNDGKAAIHLNAGQNDGVVWINNLNFTTGVLEFDVKGRNMMQQSFVGIAFHGTNDSTFDIVYFRPFNFKSDDSARRKHSVQYVSLPKYDWSYLRETFPGKYENKLTATIEPEQWFHAKIMVSSKRIAVFVNKDDKPSLVVKPLNNRSTGKIGFWVGNGSDGDFSNLTIKHN